MNLKPITVLDLPESFKKRYRDAVSQFQSGKIHRTKDQFSSSDKFPEEKGLGG